MATQGAIVVDKERCKGCGVCVVNWRNASAALTAPLYALIQLSLFIVLKSKF